MAKKITINIRVSARLLLGLIYFVFGLNGFLNFIPTPPQVDGPALTFFNGIMATGYFFPFLKGTEVFGGLLLLTGFAVPVALIILAPITLHILLFHFFVTPGLQFLFLPLVMVALHVLAATSYWNLYRPLFRRG